METTAALARGLANMGQPSRVFDWDRAARLIAEAKPDVASAGLRDDWEWTGGRIWAEGAPVPREQTYTYLASTWAIPELDMDGLVQPCWRWSSETPGWDAGTYWPQSALAACTVCFTEES